jgi:O-antigen chain-terminating methyltransferase
MIETTNSQINVDELMHKVREEVALRPKTSLLSQGMYSPERDLTAIGSTQIETCLKISELYSQVPTEFPPRFNRFPFNLSKGLQRLLLKLYGFIFKKQRVVNLSLIQALRESITINQQLIDQVTVLQAQLKEIRERIKTIDERHIRNDSYLKNDLAQQKHLITLFLEEARNRLPEPFDSNQLQTLVNEEQHLLDGFYTAFEDRFRGSREEILHRLRVYLPLLKEAKIGAVESPILDIGCGRGEWLELLEESGYTATGLDINRVMVDSCKARGLDVLETEAVSYLQNLPDFCLGAVTGFHIIEHLSFPKLKQLLGEVVRVLKPGGLVLFETPNPKNLVVGACNFYSDPTHQNPLFPDTIQFLVESQGLSNVQILYLHPVEGSPFDKEDVGLQLLHTWFFCSRDYAVVGYKL